MARPQFPLPQAELSVLVAAALAEDHAREDVTTRLLTPPEQRSRAVLLAKAQGVIAGLPVAAAAFRMLDGRFDWQELRSDGALVRPGDEIARLNGYLGPMLSAERVALNLLQHLSGVATATAQVVERLAGTRCQLRDTRKTLPGLRALQKYAVLVGGGTNHRLSLADGVLVKDNHLAALRSRGLDIADALRLVHEANLGLPVEIEVTSLQEARQALDAGAPELLLDNMPLAEMRAVVALARGRALLEASGSITLETARAVAETGVDFISMGALTHSVLALDISLEMEGL